MFFFFLLLCFSLTAHKKSSIGGHELHPSGIYPHFQFVFFGVGGDYCVWVCWYSSIGKFGCLLASGYVGMRNAILLDLVPHTLEYLPIHFRFSKSKQYTLFTIYCNKSLLGVTIWHDLLVSFDFGFFVLFVVHSSISNLFVSFLFLMFWFDICRPVNDNWPSPL